MYLARSARQYVFRVILVNTYVEEMKTGRLYCNRILLKSSQRVNLVTTNILNDVVNCDIAQAHYMMQFHL